MKPDWRQGILYLTTIGMEGCWLYAIIDLLNRKAVGGYLSVPVLLLIYPLSFGFNMLLQRLRFPRLCLRSLSWLVWAMAMLLVVKMQLYSELKWVDTSWLLAIPRSIGELIYGFKPELLILISTGVIWWLGRRLASRQSSFAALVSEFQFGLVMLVITFLVASQLGVELISPVTIAIAFFFFALLGISVAHAMEGTSWLSGLYQGHWSGLLLISISLILILGLLIASVVTPDLLQLFWTAIKWVWGVIWSLIMKVMVFLASLFPESEPVELPAMPSMPPMEPEGGFNFWPIPESVRSGLRISWTVLCVGFLLFALWRVSSDIFRWLRRKLAGMAGAEFEPLPGAFRADLFGFLKRILFKLLGLRLPFRIAARSVSVLPEMASVRQTYRWFLRWAAAAGYPRRVFQTPHEYLSLLAGLLPEAREDLDLITQQYVRVRYGASLPNEEELRRLSQSWHRVKQNDLKRLRAHHTGD